jgi:hypothetical protein
MKIKLTTTTRAAAEADSIGISRHKRAKLIEESWKMAQGINDKLQIKRQPKKTKWSQPERGQIRRREERQQDRIERVMLRRPLLKGVS